MKASRVILNRTFAITGRYRVVLYAVEVAPSKKFPMGIKAKFVLIDVEGNFPRLLVDNHEPFGFHMHTKLPEDNSVRLTLDVKDHDEAMEIFLKEVERIVDHEK